MSSENSGGPPSLAHQANGKSRWSSRAWLLGVFASVLASPGWAQMNERVSVSSSGTQGNDQSFTNQRTDACISADHRFVAFWSLASDLVPGDSNAAYDIFVRDLTAGTTQRVSVSSGGIQGDGDSHDPSISADGRFVAFASIATNLVPGDTNGTFDIFVFDRATSTIERVSVATGGAQAGNHSVLPSISADGRYVAFESASGDLVAGDNNGVSDIFVHDRTAGTTVRVSVDSSGVEGDGESIEPSISADGSAVAFASSATNLITGDANGLRDVFLHVLATGTTERVSTGLGGIGADGDSATPAVSGDGRFVAFESSATNLVSIDTNGALDVFVRDRTAGTTELASVDSAEAQGNGDSARASISSDGRWVAFQSDATALVLGDTNGNLDVFLRDRLSGTTERMSSDVLDGPADSSSGDPSISSDGRAVLFTSQATDLVPDDTNGDSDVFLRELDALDADGDGVRDENDNCPVTANPDQADADADGTGDACDGCTDTDGDGFGDPGFPANSCPADGCPNDPAKSAPGICGCGVADTDRDGDGALNCADGCPDDPAKITPGICGCGVADTDRDGDGTADCADSCPDDPAKTTPGICGCGVADTDRDGDGTADCADGCPDDPAKTDPGQAGCGSPEGGQGGDRRNSRNPGSLLIFPEFDNRAGDVSEFTVTNTNRDFSPDPATHLARGTIRVHFVYVGRYDAAGNPIPCLEVDRLVTLTPGDTFTFLTRTHNPQQQQGFMYAYAEHPTTGQPIAFDDLIGSAVFVNGLNAIDYSTNPISLKARCPAGTPTDIDHDGNRDLDGLEYEELPDRILIPRFLATGGILRSELILLGLSGGASFETVADFLVYNDNEEVFSAQRQFRCWERAPLDVISGVFTQQFLSTTNHAINEPLGAPGRESGWIQIDGGIAFSMVEQIDNPAVYAVLVERVARGAGASDLPFEVGSRATGSLWPNGPWGDGARGDQR